MPESLFGILILILVLVLVFWLLATYVVPALPAPIGKVVLAVLALIVVLFLLSHFLGWGWTGTGHRLR